MRRLLIGPLLVAFVPVFDQLTKWWVTETVFRPMLGLGDAMRLGDWLMHAPERLTYASIPVLPVFNLNMVWNEGISFGFLNSHGPMPLTIMSMIIATIFFGWMLKTNNVLERIGLGLIVGGALGNAFDRIRFGAVVDFIQLHWGNAFFPAFNVADSAISIGVLLLVIQGLFFAKKSA